MDFLDRHTERKIEQKAAIPVLAAYEQFGSDAYLQRDQTGGGKHGQGYQAKKEFFDEAGPTGTISADWRAMTDNVSPMVKRGGTVVDLGGSSGRYAEFLAMSRSDLKVICIEPDAERYKLAVEQIKKAGLADRVTLINKPVPDALNELARSGAKVDMMTSIYRTHLQTDAQNVADMKAMGNLARLSGASIITHDLHRPVNPKTVDLMANIYPGDSAGPDFREGYRAGMRSAYRGAEMETLLERHVGAVGWENRVARPLGQMQMHLMRGAAAPLEGQAPNPVYPQMPKEYVEVADDMNMILRMGRNVENALDSGRGLKDSFYRAVHNLGNLIPALENHLGGGMAQNFDAPGRTR